MEARAGRIDPACDRRKVLTSGEDGRFADHAWPAHFLRDPLIGGGERIISCGPLAREAAWRALTAAAEGPFTLLYVLHSPPPNCRGS